MNIYDNMMNMIDNNEWIYDILIMIDIIWWMNEIMNESRWI